MTRTDFGVRSMVAMLAAVIGCNAPANARADSDKPQQLVPAQEIPKSSLAQQSNPRLAPGQPIPHEELEAFVDGIVQLSLANDHPVGTSVAVVQGGQIVLSKGYGIADVSDMRRFDPQLTLSRIGSISKTFTWILLMKEVERGRIDLGAPVNDYLPDELKIPDQGFRNPIRVIHLMDHTPGFEDLTLGHLIVAKPDDVLPTDQYLAKHRPDRVREPGVQPAYSNYGVALAGYIVARINGTDFQTLAEREIFQPLGMKSTTFREPYEPRPDLPAPMPKELAARMANAITWQNGLFRQNPRLQEYVTQIAPAGSVWTTANDMARYMLMQLNDGNLDGAVVYGPDTARAFRTPVMRESGATGDLAHGFYMIDMPGGFKAYGHSGGTISFGGYMVVVPQLDLGVFSMTNTSEAAMFAYRLPGLIVERFYAPSSYPLQRVGSSELAQYPSRYAGRYLSTRRTFSGLEKFIGLVGGRRNVAVTTDGYLIAGTGPVGTQAWVPDGAPGHFRAANDNDTLAFDLDERGRAIGYSTSHGYSERAGWLLDPALFKTTAVLAGAAALALWIGVVMRLGRKTAATRWQSVSTTASLAVAVLWIVAFAAYHVGLSQASETALMFDFPLSAWIVASAAALLAAIGTTLLVALLPSAWCGQPSTAGWTVWRKTRHCAVVTVFAAFSILIGYMGGLQPWQ